MFDVITSFKIFELLLGCNVSILVVQSIHVTNSCTSSDCFEGM